MAARCEECDLEEFGGHAGRVLFEQARQAPEKARHSYYAVRRNVSLSNGAIMQVVIDQDLI